MALDRALKLKLVVTRSWGGGHRNRIKKRSKRVKLLFPLNCFTVHSDQLYTWCKRGCLQYVIIRPVMTFTAVLAESSYFRAWRAGLDVQHSTMAPQPGEGVRSLQRPPQLQLRVAWGPP